MTYYITPFGRVYRRRDWTPSQEQAVEELSGEAQSRYAEVLIPVNVRTAEDEFVITALLPGLKAEDLRIQVVNETITLQGELPREADDRSNYLVYERPAGKFYRVINLPDALDSSKAEADLKDGVLTLRVPKAEEVKPKTIKVNLN